MKEEMREELMKDKVSLDNPKDFEEEEIVVDDISEITEHKTTRTYDITWGNKEFIVEEVISWNEDGQRNEVIEVVEGGTKEENEEVLTWIENNYDKINL